MWACATAGETGEMCNAVKKLKRIAEGTNTAKDPQTEADAIAEIGKELADMITYADLLAARLGIDLESAIVTKFNEVSDRMGCTIKLAHKTAVSIRGYSGELIMPIAFERLAAAMRGVAEEHRNGSSSAHDVHDLLLALSRILEGKTVQQAFGAPGDWGYDTPIGVALAAERCNDAETIKPTSCPQCGVTEWIAGPSGGGSQNVQCAGCKKWFNQSVFGLEDIGGPVEPDPEKWSFDTKTEFAKKNAACAGCGRKPRRLNPLPVGWTWDTMEPTNEWLWCHACNATPAGE